MPTIHPIIIEVSSQSKAMPYSHSTYVVAEPTKPSELPYTPIKEPTFYIYRNPEVFCTSAGAVPNSKKRRAKNNRKKKK